MSNLYKNGFVVFSKQNTLVIDANHNRIIRQMEEQKQKEAKQQESEEGETSEDDAFHSFEIENIDMTNVREQADAVFENARAAAEKILEEARAEALMLKEEEKQNGHDEGYRKGMEDAREQLAAQEAEQLDHFERMKQSLEDDYTREVQTIEPMLVDVICKLLHKITGVLVSDYHDVLVHIIDNAVKDVENSTHLAIKVSEDDYADVYSRFEFLKQQTDSNTELELIADPKLNKLECLIETDTGIINCGLDEQLENLITNLKLLSIT